MEKKKIVYLILGFILCIYFFLIPVHIFWDSAHYMTYVSIFEGVMPWNSWDIVRGIIFPLLIYISNLLFGKTVQGLLLLTFLFYLGMLLAVKLIIDQIFSRKEKKEKNIVSIIVFSIIILDPIIYGYYHALLTEFVAMTVSLVMCYLSWKWMHLDFFKDRKKYVIYSFVFFLGTIFSWHLKQPYVSITIFPVLIASIISILRSWNLKNILPRLTTVFSCIIGLVLSVLLWNNFLSSKDINLNTDRNVTASFGNQLLFGLNNYEFLKEFGEEDVQYLTKEEEKKLLQNKEKYHLVNIKKPNGKIIAQTLISLDSSENIGTGTAITFILKQLFTHPYLTIESYTSNYLAIANLFPKDTQDGANYWIDKDFTLDYCHENCIIATGVRLKKSNVASMPESYYNLVSDYEQFNNSSIFLRGFLRITSKVAPNIFKIVILFLPVLIICLTVSTIKNRKTKNIEFLTMLTILSWYSFLHLLVHVVTGASIDRYAAPIYIPVLLSFILYGYYLIKIRRLKN